MDVCIRALIPSARLEVAVATTTALCQDAQKAHRLRATSIIALGRLLTAATLVALTSKRKGSTSLQIVTRSRMKQVFADVNHEGHGRGFVRNAELAFPVMSGERSDGRRGIALAMTPGKLSIVRSSQDGQYTQSTTDLVSGEVDTDVEHFLEQSDQIPTALACDILIAEDERVELAGGVLVQALPGADEDRLRALRAALKNDATTVDSAVATGLPDRLRTHRDDPLALLKAFAPDATPLESPTPVLWKCRCSRTRVLAALKMFDPSELAEMASSDEPVSVGCDLCAASYLISAAEIHETFLATIKAEG